MSIESLPATIKSLWYRLLHRERIDSDLDAEIQSALALLTDQKIAQGMSQDEARRAATIELGGIEQLKEQVRASRTGAWLDSLFQDIRFALRMLRKSPGFTTVAVITLALGIGANTAIFGLVDSAFLRGLPFRQPQRLVHIWTIEGDREVHTPTPIEYQAVKENTTSFDEVAANGWADYFYAPDAFASQDLPGLLVTANWLPTLGIKPLLGRNFRSEEQIAGQDAVVMLSYDCWHRRFHADPAIIGRQIVLNHRPVTVIAVLPQSLEPYYGHQIFAPLILDSYAKQADLRAGKVRVEIVARMKPGVTLAQARSEADVVSQELTHSSALPDRNDRLFVEDFGEMFEHPGPTRQNALYGLWLAAIASGLVLLVACANVASLLLARGVKRQREIAVRSALGCSRGRMIRQLLTESAILFLCGGLAAIIATRWCQDIITRVASGLVPGVYLHVDSRVFSVCLAVSLLSALAFGMIPALQASRANPNDNLKDGSRIVSGGTHARTLRNYLVASQVALGMVLLVSFGLLLRSILHVESSRLGYDPNNVLTATVRLPAAGLAASDRVRLMREAADRTRLMPGVESVGIADSLPMQGADSAQLRIQVPVPNALPVEDEIWFVSVGPRYFSTLQVPMLAGRAFRQTDNQDGSPVAIINQTFAKHYFPGTNPVGYHVAFADSPTVWREIVGIVFDFRQRNPEEDIRPLAYFPVAQTLPNEWSMAIRVRAAGDMGTVASGVANGLQSMAPQLYWETSSMRTQLHDSESLTLRRPMIALLASFGALALVLVVVSVFGVTSYSVAERTREIGIRAALGAAPAEIARLILRESLAVASVGLAVGTLCAFAVVRFFPTEGIGWSGSGIFVYGVSRMDPSTYVSAAILLTAIVIVASLLPARRATRIDPMSAIRCD